MQSIELQPMDCQQCLSHEGGVPFLQRRSALRYVHVACKDSAACWRGKAGLLSPAWEHLNRCETVGLVSFSPLAVHFVHVFRGFCRLEVVPCLHGAVCVNHCFGALHTRTCCE